MKTPETLATLKSALFELGRTAPNDELNQLLHSVALDAAADESFGHGIFADDLTYDEMQDLALAYKSGFWSPTFQGERDAMRTALVAIRDYPVSTKGNPDDLGDALDAIGELARRGLSEESAGPDDEDDTPDALDPTNTERAAWASVALHAHSVATGGDDEDAVCDLLANLGHYCDANGISFAEQLQRACDHYHAESKNRLC